MDRDVQVKAKERIRELLEEYDVRYLDYNVNDDEYTICLEKIQEKEN